MLRSSNPQTVVTFTPIAYGKVGPTNLLEPEFIEHVSPFSGEKKKFHPELVSVTQIQLHNREQYYSYQLVAVWKLGIPFQE